MKKLVFALACLAIGSGAFASDSKTTYPAERNATEKATEKATPSNTGIKVGKFKQQASKFRIQRRFMIMDHCGQLINVYVSAPNGTSWDAMFDVAMDHVLGCENSNGCYQA